MPNRRKERERRHRIAHGTPLPRDERTPKPERTPKAERLASTRSPKARGSAASGRRPVPEPSLQRSLRRGALVLVALFALIYLVDRGKHPVGTDLVQALFGAALFIPFDYGLTRLVYTRFNKRLGS
jgi:hypothetical protein